MITCIGSLVCNALGAIGAEELVARSCSQVDNIYGIGLIATVTAGLLALGFFLLWGR